MESEDGLMYPLTQLEAIIARLLLIQAAGVLEPHEATLAHFLADKPGKPTGFRWDELLEVAWLATQRHERRMAELAEDVGRLGERLSYVTETWRQCLGETRQVAAQLAQGRATAQQMQGKLEEQEAALADAQAYLAALSADVPLRDLPLPRIVPVRVYLRDGSEGVESVSRAVESLLRSAGFDISGDLPPETGSWYKRWFAKTKEALTAPQVVERLEKVERAAELEYISTKQAEADRNHAEAVAALIQSLQNEQEAAVQAGSILLLKFSDEHGHSRIVTRTLTQRELVAIERAPQLLKDPVGLLAALAGGAASLPDGKPYPQAVLNGPVSALPLPLPPDVPEA